MWPVWCTSMQGIYAQLEEGVGSQSAIGICAFFYIYIYIDLPLDVPSVV